VLEHTLTQEERSQIAQTIEMFEVITQTQSDDYQSLEILKDAYAKLGRADDALKASRRLAEAYFNVGSYTMAMQECEAILQAEPNAPEMLAMLGEIEARVHGTKPVAFTNGTNGNGNGAEMVGADGGLIRANSTNGVSPGSLIDNTRSPQYSTQDRGDDQLAKFFIMQQLFTEEEVEAAMNEVRAINGALTSQAMASSLIDKLCGGRNDKTDQVLSALIDRTKFAYVPLEHYDVDRQVARMLPEELTLGRMFVPFDLISRTIMIACSNPFDAAGREAVQQSLDYTVAWYLARPSAIAKSLSDVYRLDSRA
jgi:tetratricopeptide (TPR) repeat protein